MNIEDYGLKSPKRIPIAEDCDIDWVEDSYIVLDKKATSRGYVALSSMITIIDNVRAKDRAQFDAHLHKAVDRMRQATILDMKDILEKLKTKPAPITIADEGIYLKIVKDTEHFTLKIIPD